MQCSGPNVSKHPNNHADSGGSKKHDWYLPCVYLPRARLQLTNSALAIRPREEVAYELQSITMGRHAIETNGLFRC